MNKNIFLFFIVLVFGIEASASVWRVNNNDTTAHFKELDLANSNPKVVNGDTLYVEGSVKLYLNCTISKRLVIIGPGYFHAMNKLHGNNLTAELNYVSLNASASGSVIIGVSCLGFSTYASNVVFTRSKVTNSLSIQSGLTGVRITCNYLNYLNFSGNYSDIYVNNNIITGGINANKSSQITTFNNNILLSGGTGSSAEFRFSATNVRNNIFVHANPVLDAIYATASNNISLKDLFGAGNQVVSDVNSLFVGGGSSDGKYILSAASAAKGAGYNGTDCGIFGGAEPYVLSGLPPVPFIQQLDVDDIVSGDKLKVKVKVSSF